MFSLLYDEDTARKVAREEALEEGLEKGREEGREEGRLEIVRNLLNMNFPITQIMKAVGMTRQEIENLQV